MTKHIFVFTQNLFYDRNAINVFFLLLSLFVVFFNDTKGEAEKNTRKMQVTFCLLICKTLNNFQISKRKLYRSGYAMDEWNYYFFSKKKKLENFSLFVCVYLDKKRTQFS